MHSASYVASSTISAVPTVILYTSAFFDTSCSCTRTGTFSTTSFVTPTGAGVATTTGSGATKTGSGSGATGAAEKMDVGFGGAMALVMAGLLNVILVAS